MSSSMSNRIREFLWRWLCLYIFLYIATISFDFSLLPNPMTWLGGFFQHAAAFSGQLFFSVTLTGEHEFYSDSLLVYVHLFNLLLISAITSIVWTWRAKKEFTSTQLYPSLLIVVRYFLALMLFIYGFNKIFKWQFMLPEPNILYQTVGNTPRDLLYWTSMGTSYTYSVFMGVIEVVPAFLLLFRRTTLIGAIISLLVMTNVVFVNLGFDITVKVHSFMLCMMSLILVLPARKRLFAFFSGRANEAWSYPALSTLGGASIEHLDFARHKLCRDARSDKDVPIRRSSILLKVIKVSVILVLLAEANYRYIETMNFNDDKAERPPMFGAYERLSLVQPVGGTLNYANPEFPEYIFVHSRGYLILQYADGTVKDYLVATDTLEQKFIVDNSYYDGTLREVRWSQEDDSHFVFTFVNDNAYQPFEVQKLDLGKLPLMQEEFGWVDEQ